MRRLAVSLAALSMMALLAPAHARPFPERIDLPDGFFPEGIAIAPGGTFFTGSLSTGAIYRGDVKTGEGDILVPPQAGRIAVGMKVHKGLLYVAGGDTGDAYVYDARTGAEVATYQLAGGAAFINDVVVTKDAAYFTDSFNPVLYRVPVSRSGAPGTQASVTALPLTGDLVYETGFNVNGIDATPDGKTLVLVQSNTGELFTADPETGVTSEIDLGGGAVASGDGILLDGKTLYVVQNFLNQIAEVRLSADLSSGKVVSTTPDDDFDIPTTVAEFGNRLVVANARFTTPTGPDVDYWLAVLRKPGHS
jgi:outer membrane protein assembly factor BamB